jgi:hypothetical protein
MERGREGGRRLVSREEVLAQRRGLPLTCVIGVLIII